MSTIDHRLSEEIEIEEKTVDQQQVGQYESLIADIDRIKKRHKVSKKQLNDNIDKVIKNLLDVRNEIDDLPEPIDEEIENQNSEQINTLIDGLHNKLVNQKPLKNIFNNHKEYFAYLSKIGKNIEKYFNKDMNTLCQDYNFDAELIHKVIGDHLMREGQSAATQILQEETGTRINLNIKDDLETIQIVNESLRQKQTIKAIEWANKKYEKLKEIGSNILFNLHKLQYVTLVRQAKRDEAIEYARQYFLQFCDEQQEIQKLMGSLLYIGMNDKSPYPIFHDKNEESNWSSIIEQFILDSCRVYKIPSQSALLLTTTAGTLSLPRFLKLQSILGENSDWRKKNNEIAIEFEFGNKFKFHSIFVCPVSREPMDPSQPPQLLKCGHVISKISLEKITSDGQRPRFKCPTCQMTQKMSEAQQLQY